MSLSEPSDSGYEDPVELEKIVYIQTLRNKYPRHLRLRSIPEDVREFEESKSRFHASFADTDGSKTEFLGAFASV